MSTNDNERGGTMPLLSPAAASAPNRARPMQSWRTQVCAAALVGLLVATMLVATRADAGAQVDRGCTNAVPDRLDPPVEFAAFIVACSTSDGRVVTIENVSAGVVRLLPLRPTTWSDWTAPISAFTYQAAAAVVSGGVVDAGRAYLAFDLRPEEKIKASVRTGVVDLLIDVRYSASAYSYVARFAAEWVKSQFGETLPRGLQTLVSFSDCVKEVAVVLSDDSAYWEDLVRSAIKSSASCGSFAQDVLEYVDEWRNVTRTQALSVFAGQMDNLADDAARAGWAGRTAFDDLIRAATKAARVFT